MYIVKIFNIYLLTINEDNNIKNVMRIKKMFRVKSMMTCTIISHLVKNMRNEK